MGNIEYLKKKYICIYDRVLSFLQATIHNGFRTAVTIYVWPKGLISKFRSLTFVLNKTDIENVSVKKNVCYVCVYITLSNISS